MTGQLNQTRSTTTAASDGDMRPSPKRHPPQLRTSGLPVQQDLLRCACGCRFQHLVQFHGLRRPHVSVNTRVQGGGDTFALGCPLRTVVVTRRPILPAEGCGHAMFLEVFTSRVKNGYTKSLSAYSDSKFELLLCRGVSFRSKQMQGLVAYQWPFVLVPEGHDILLHALISVSAAVRPAPEFKTRS
jgi:hypothetical protein